jgi:hypothetical protein
MEEASKAWWSTTTYHSFNLGQILLPPNTVSLLPILLFWCFMAYRVLGRGDA